jgi:MFS family permease
MGIDALMVNGTIDPGSGWRWMFLIGAAPALLILFSRNRLKEPEAWTRLKKKVVFRKAVSLLRMSAHAEHALAPKSDRGRAACHERRLSASGHR